MKKIAAVVLVLILCLSGCGREKLTDGRFMVEVSLSGGSGRASVSSPAELEIDGDSYIATVVFSSPYYEYITVNGVRYNPIQTEGNSTFEIPIVFDEEVSIQALTVAMSEPHLIDYTLYFDSRTLKKK